MFSTSEARATHADTSESLRFLSQCPLTCLVGPANAGKTGHFLALSRPEAKIVMSVVDREELIDKSMPAVLTENVLFSNIRKIFADDEDDDAGKDKKEEEVFDPSAPNQFVDLIKFLTAQGNQQQIILLVDEIHLFSDRDIKLLSIFMLTLRPTEVFVTILPGSFHQRPFPLTAHVLALANNIVTIPGTCHLCGARAFRSVKITEKNAAQDDILVGKRNFIAQCWACFTKSE